MPSVDGRRNAIDSFGEHGKYSVINIVVNQDNPLSGASNEIGDERPSIPDAASGEDLLGEEFWTNVLDSIKNNLNRFVCLLLMLLYVEDTLNNLRVVIDELRNYGKSAHDADVDFHSSIRP